MKYEKLKEHTLYTLIIKKKTIWNKNYYKYEKVVCLIILVFSRTKNFWT